MASPNSNMNSTATGGAQAQGQSHNKKKGKSKKSASTEDGVPSHHPSVDVVHSKSDTHTHVNKGPGTEQSQTGKDKSQSKDAQVKKSDNQSKSSKSTPKEAAKSPGEGEAGVGGGGGGEQAKSKAQLKAERRAIQERQRAAKESKKTEASGGTGAAGAASAAGAAGGGAGGAAAAGGGKKDRAGSVSKKDTRVGDGAAASAAGDKTQAKKKTGKVESVNLSGEQRWVLKEKEMLTRGAKIDDGIFSLGFQYLHRNIVGADARCVALLTTLKEVIAKYKTPEEKELSRDLEKNFLAPCIKYINDCRPLSTSMGNAIKHLKQHISKIPQGMEDDKAIAMLQEVIDNFIYDNITKAAEAVANYANDKIDHGDVILIYAASSLISQVLKYAHDKGKQFRVIVVEGRPRTEGKTMLRYLVRCGIPCSYIYIGSASHAMRETTKVFLGAAAMFAIGDMHSRTGNAMIAALAKANNIPVLVCCESYKFTDKVLLSSGSSSSQQDRGKDLLDIGHRPAIIPNHEDIDLHLLNILYDVTHSGYITALVTELGMLPCTSVPVVLRRQEDKGTLDREELWDGYSRQASHDRKPGYPL